MMTPRQEAAAKGEKTYKTRPCQYGHNSLRYTNSGGCVACRCRVPPSRLITKELAAVPRRLDTFGARIARTRKQMGIAQIDLARKIKVTVTFLCRIEHNQQAPSIWVVAEIAKVLDVSIDFLCCFTDNNQVRL